MRIISNSLYFVFEIGAFESSKQASEVVMVHSKREYELVRIVDDDDDELVRIHSNVTIPSESIKRSYFLHICLIIMALGFSLLCFHQIYSSQYIIPSDVLSTVRTDYKDIHTYIHKYYIHTYYIHTDLQT